MRSNEQFTKDIIRRTKAARKKRRVVIGSVVLGVCAFLGFFIGYSNVVTIAPYKNSYMSYLLPYFSTEEEVGFRFVDEQSAVVQIESKAYPCSYEATSKTEFTLTVVENEEEEPLVLANENEEPSVFRLEFWDTNAKLSWNIFGTKIEKILSVTAEKNIPSGLWGLCATQDGDGGAIHEREEIGAGWTLILENGDSYTGEGMDSAWKTKFIAIGDTLFQCMFDPVSGVILDASVFVYDETTFDYPVIKEHYLSDGDPYYFYSRLLSDEEKIDFTGGLFNASGILRTVENHRIETPSALHKEVASWQLTPTRSQEKSELSANTVLDLNEDGTVKLKISGNNEFKGSFGGNWYALKHCVLVVLDKKSELVGQAFTLYVKNEYGSPDGEKVTQYGQSYVESFDCYKTGYHTFNYYVSESRTELYWGKAWENAESCLQLQYEKEYILYGEYYYEHFDGDGNADVYAFDESMLVEFPQSGQVSVVFHKDGTATAKTPTETETLQYAYDPEGNYIEFTDEWIFYVGKNMPLGYDRNWKSYTLRVNDLSCRFDCLYEDRISYHSSTDVDGNTKRAEVVYYRLYFKPKTN